MARAKRLRSGEARAKRLRSGEARQDGQGGSGSGAAAVVLIVHVHPDDEGEEEGWSPKTYEDLSPSDGRTLINAYADLQGADPLDMKFTVEGASGTVRPLLDGPFVAQGIVSGTVVTVSPSAQRVGQNAARLEFELQGYWDHLR